MGVMSKNMNVQTRCANPSLRVANVLKRIFPRQRYAPMHSSGWQEDDDTLNLELLTSSELVTANGLPILGWWPLNSMGDKLFELGQTEGSITLCLLKTVCQQKTILREIPMLLFLPPAPVCWPKQLLCHQLAYPNSNQWWQPLATLIQTLPLTVYLVQNVSVHKQKARIQCSSKSQKNMEDPLEFQFSCCLLQFAINWSKYAQCNVVWQGKECFSEQTRKTGIQCSRKSRKYGRCTWISVQSLPLAVFYQLRHRNNSFCWATIASSSIFGS